MTKKVLMIHTVPALVEVFQQLSRQLLPGVQVFHLLDELVLEDVRASGQSMVGQDPTFRPLKRLGEHLAYAGENGIDAVLVTCSTLSPGVSALVPTAGRVPVVRIDEAMIEKAVELAARSGGRIGVVATNPTTLDPTRDALERQAARTGKAVQVRVALVGGAFDRFRAGDLDTHDALVAQAVRELQGQVDVIVLAQATMARVLDALPPGSLESPVLTSPHTALERLKETLESR